MQSTDENRVDTCMSTAAARLTLGLRAKSFGPKQLLLLSVSRGTSEDFTKMPPSGEFAEDDMYPEFLSMYYKRIFPHRQYFKWLSYGEGEIALSLCYKKKMY